MTFPFDVETLQSHPSMEPDFSVDQIKAADNVYLAIEALKSAASLPEGLKAVEETDVYRLRRGLCLPSASATCINKVLNFRLIGDEEGPLTIGDFYQAVLPFHGYQDPNHAGNLPKGWLVSTDQGDIYHHAIIAFSNALGVDSQPVGNFRSITEFKPNLRAGEALAISLDNTFVIDQTLKSSPDLVSKENGNTSVLIEGQNGIGFRKFEHGRHVVAITGISEKGLYRIYDSFRLPQMSPEQTILELPSEVVDSYLNYTLGGASRGILFSNNATKANPHPAKLDATVPPDIVKNVKFYIQQKLTT